MSTIKNATLYPAEKILKISSIPVGIASLGASGSPLERATSGTYKVITETMDVIPSAYDTARALITTAKELAETSKLNLSIDLATVQNTVDYASQFMQNVRAEPLESAAVAIGLSALLYTSGAVAGFVRREGKGTFIQERTRELGDKIWRNKKTK